MKLFRASLVLLTMTCAIGAAAQDVPEWATRVFAAPANTVFAAALRSIQVQKHELKAKDEKAYTADFHVGVTAWSWGYNMRLTVTPLDNDRSRVVVGVLKSGGKVFSWGSGSKEVRKILGGIDAELASAKLNPQTPKTAAAQQVVTSECSVTLKSEPSGADVELDGKFVGQTPSKIRVQPGEHKLVVKRDGYVTWERTISALADSDVSITAELRKRD